MCDFSLEFTRSRAAEDNEDLVLKKFPSYTQGFVSAKEGADQDCAVCCKSGVEMTVHLEGTFPVRAIDDVTGFSTETFSGDTPVKFHTHTKVVAHRDGFATPGGWWLSLQDLPIGTLATVTKALPKEIADAIKTGSAFEPEIEVGQIEAPAPQVQATY